MKYSVATAVMVLTAGIALAEVAPNDLKISEDMFIAASTMGASGIPDGGVKAIKGAEEGTCRACEAMNKELLQGNVGTAPDSAGSRYAAEQLRSVVVDSEGGFGSDTVMPGFYRLDVGKSVVEGFVGRTVLAAQQIEDIVAYLVTSEE